MRPEFVHLSAWVFRGMVPGVATLRKDLVAAEIEFKDERGRRADFHALRMTAIDAVRRSGATPDVLMQFARHSDLGLTWKVDLDVTHWNSR